MQAQLSRLSGTFFGRKERVGANNERTPEGGWRRRRQR